MKTIKTKLTQGNNQYLFKMFRFMRPYGLRYAITQFIYSSQGFALPFIFAIFSGNIMAAILSGDAEGVLRAAALFAIMVFGYLLVFLVAVAVNIIVVERAILDMKRSLFRTFVRTGLEDASHSGEGIAAINTDSDTAANIFQGPLMFAMQSIITIVGSVITIFIIDIRLGLASLAVGILSFFMQKRFTIPLAKVGKERLEANSSALKSASNVFSGAMAIRAYNMQPQAFITFDRDNSRLKMLDIRQGFIRMGQRLFSTIEGWLTLLVVFGFGGWLAATGRLEFYLVVVVFSMSASLSSSIGALGEVYAGLQPPIAGAKRVFAILEKGESLSQKKMKRTAPSQANGYGLSIKNLIFRYQDGELDTLSDINIEVGENQMIALVGESGSGKSTLLRAIIGMYERDDLGLSLGGISYNDTNIKDWRQNFAYVDQSCTLFDMSIKENIAIGAGGNCTDEDIISAAKQAAAHDFIESLEGGYDAPCGEKGNTLSGGQKQRIAIARALVKKAPILVFDEATSALDKETERNIMDTIQNLRENHTILITTHNLDNVVDVDMIIKMDGGRLVRGF